MAMFVGMATSNNLWSAVILCDPDKADLLQRTLIKSALVWHKWLETSGRHQGSLGNSLGSMA